MPKEMLEEKINGRAPTAIDYALANHKAETGDAQLEFESDAELMSVEFDRMRAFLEQKSKQKRSNSVFFRVNNQPILGAKGQLLQAGAIPLFSGAALDLTSAELKGEKKFMKPPEAQGTGGILVLAPQKFNQGLTLPISSLKLKENFVEGEISLNNRSGFHGNHVRLTAEKIHITNEKAEFVNPQMVYKTEEAESAVPIPEKVTVTESGLAPDFLTKNLRINVPAASTTALNDTTDVSDTATVSDTTNTADISNVIDTTNVTDVTDANDVTDVTNVTEETNSPAEETTEPTEEVAQMEPDRLVFVGGPGKFTTKKGIRPQMRLTSYNGFSVQWKDGNLIAYVHVDANEYEINLQPGNEKHTYYSADGVTIVASDSWGLINGILSDLGVSDAEVDDSSLCYEGLEITEEGIFFSSMKNSILKTNIGDDWNVKIGNSPGFSLSGDLLGSEEDDDDGSYYDLAKNVLQFLGIIKGDEDEGESEEEAENDGNQFQLSVPFITFPLIPGLASIDAVFAAGASIGYKFGGSVDNILSLLNNTDTGDLGLNLYAALKGNAYAGFQVGLTVGPSFLMNVNGRIGAKIALTGDEDGGNILSTNLYLGFKKNRYGRVSFQKAVIDASGELRLRAIIDASLNTQILGWEKTLCSYTFADWELAAIAAAIKASRENGKWVAQASANYRALGGTVNKMLDNKDELEKMISKKEESYGKAAFDASQSSFEDAKRMLYQYQNKDIPMFVSMDESNSGFLDMNKVIQEIQHKFYVQLRDTQETIALGREEIEALKNDKSYQKSGRTIQENLKKHSNNLQNIAKASADNSKTSASPRGARTAAVPTPSQKIMDAYAAGGGNKKDFYSYLQNKSKQEAVTVDSLIAYEENRRKELTQKSENRIQKMKEFAAAQNIAETDKTKGSVLLKKYRELGGKAVNKVLFTDISTLLQYEQSRLLENRSQWFSGAAAQYHERKERIDELAKKFPDIVQNGSDAPNADFFRYYTKTLGARELFNRLDIYSNRERLLAYERRAVQNKLRGNKKGRTAMQNREELRKLLSKESRDANEVQKWQETIQGEKQLKGEEGIYMTATKEDFVQALEKKQKAMALKQSVMQARKKGGNWFYESVKMDITIDDLIAYEKQCLSMSTDENWRNLHAARIRLLSEKKSDAEKTRKTNPQDAEKKLYDTIQAYFQSNKVASDKGEGFKNHIMRRVENEDASVQKLFKSKKWTSEETEDMRKLKEDPSSIYSLVRRYGLRTKDSNVDSDANKKLLTAYIQEQGPKEYSLEDLERFYTYQIHRATKAKSVLGERADHITILEVLESMTDYPAMLRKYKEMGRGKNFLSHEQDDAPNWVTPNMILEYERSFMRSLDQKHLDRIETLRTAESGTEEEQKQAIKEYAENSKRFNAKVSDESVKISLLDIINSEIARQAMKMSVHDQRIAQLRSTDPEMTDEIKISAYDGSRFEPAKEDVDRIYSQYIQKIESNPASMAEELTAFETQEKEKQEERQKQWKKLETDISDRIIILVEQAEQCMKVVQDTENAIKNPDAIFASEANTNNYVTNVLDKTKTDMQQVPEILKNNGQ